MNTRPEALRLADQLDDPVNAKLYLAPYISAELRRLHALNADLLEALKVSENSVGDFHALEIVQAAIAKAEGA